MKTYQIFYLVANEKEVWHLTKWQKEFKAQIQEQKQKKMTLEEIKNNWTETDKILYKTPEIKLKSLEASKTKVIS